MNLDLTLLDLTLENILNLGVSFLNDNTNISYINDVQKLPGDEHYLFLAALGMQMKNKTIIELGTHNGRSAISLNYGNLKNHNDNTIITYDINNFLLPNIFDNTNIIFKMDNLFDNKTRDDNKEFILSSDLIFIDVDPHEGVVEFEMYTWLKENNYKGLILFDDIHLGVGHLGVFTGNCMQQFWDKVDDKYKIDLTHVGHYSGTGLVCFCFENYNIKY